MINVSADRLSFDVPVEGKDNAQCTVRLADLVAHGTTGELLQYAIFLQLDRIAKAMERAETFSAPPNTPTVDEVMDSVAAKLAQLGMVPPGLKVSEPRLNGASEG